VCDYVSTRGMDDDPELAFRDGIVIDERCDLDTGGEPQYLVARNVAGRFVTEWFEHRAVRYVEPSSIHSRHGKVWLAIRTLFRDAPKKGSRLLRPDEVRMLGWAHFLAAQPDERLQPREKVR
jgi:hypothetical protein